ncbi:restriction endonuclease subunit S [Vibrio cholerae]
MSFEYENLENLNIQLIDGDRGKNYPKQSEFQESGYCLFLSAKNVTKSGFQFSEKVYVSEERHNLLRAGKLERYDIVLTTRGTIGNVAFYDNSVLDDVVRVNSGMLILRAKTTVWNPRFLYFLFTSKIIQEQISSLTSGSAVPQLPAKDLRKFLLPKVPMGVQNYIVKVIGDLSDKLKINDQTNQTLEEMAQAIFKSWFVDFDPVKAKMNGEQPEGMDAATASLFPEKLVESELGLIPEGWKVDSLAKIAKLDTTSVNPAKEPEIIWEHFSIPAFDAGCYPSFDTGESIKSGKYAVKDNSVLVSKLNPRFQRIWLPLPTMSEKAICSTEFMQFVPNCSAFKAYLYNLVKSTPFQNELLNTVTGTTGSRQRAQPKQVAKAQVVIPSSKLMEIYCQKVDAMLSLSQQNIRQNIELAKLRDTLLPKLLSGEIELSAEL